MVRNNNYKNRELEIYSEKINWSVFITGELISLIVFNIMYFGQVCLIEIIHNVIIPIEIIPVVIANLSCILVTIFINLDISKMKKPSFIRFIFISFLWGMLVVCFLVFIGYYVDIAQSPFTITQKVCHNETIEEQPYVFPRDFEKIDCPNNISEVPCYDSKNNEIVGLICKDMRIGCFKLNNLSGVTFIYNDYDNTLSSYPISLSEAEKLTRVNITKEVCEQIEIDDIIIPNPKFNKTICAEKSPCHNLEYCIELESDGVPIECINMNSVMPKKYLTIDWVNRNCECKEKCEKRLFDFKTYCANDETSSIKCSKYSCFGNYTVEVNR